MERAMGFEPTTPSLGSWYSTTELRPLIVCLQDYIYLNFIMQALLHLHNEVQIKQDTDLSQMPARQRRLGGYTDKNIFEFNFFLAEH